MECCRQSTMGRSTLTRVDMLDPFRPLSFPAPPSLLPPLPLLRGLIPWESIFVLSGEGDRRDPIISMVSRGVVEFRSDGIILSAPGFMFAAETAGSTRLHLAYGTRSVSLWRSIVILYRAVALLCNLLLCANVSV